jgi:Protein of unknown function (DUF3105)
VANRQSGGDRLTKAERKEQARVEREQIQRQMAARTRNRKIGTALVAIAIVVVVIAAFLFRGAGLPKPADLLAKAASEQTAAGCAAVQTTPNYSNATGADPQIDHAHIGSSVALQTPPPLSSYPTTPPASGPHDATYATAGVYSSPPDIYQTIHSIEHAAVIVWYAPAAAGSDAVAQIRSFYGQLATKENVGQAKIIVSPYDFPAQGAKGSLLANVQMALVAWHHLQYCARPNLAAAFDFSSKYSNAYPGGHYIGEAREPSLPI